MEEEYRVDTTRYGSPDGAKAFYLCGEEDVEVEISRQGIIVHMKRRQGREEKLIRKKDDLIGKGELTGGA